MAGMRTKAAPPETMSGPLCHNPFAGIRKMLKDKPPASPPPHPISSRKTVAGASQRLVNVEISAPPGDDDGGRVFLAAMQDVVPLARDKERELLRRERTPQYPGAVPESEDREAVEQLTRLVTAGEGFILSLTPEYIEGTGYNIHADYARRLHAGDFSIQAHLDLHGLTVVAAREVFDGFMQEAVMTGKTGVLIIHGRGLSSPAEPVLKKKVVEWLTTGIWRKRIFAYASARSCDGGTGATYVLLRPRAPRSKHK